jgi:hypothetical protein
MINLIIYTLWAAMAVSSHHQLPLPDQPRPHVFVLLAYSASLSFHNVFNSSFPYLPDAFLSHSVYLGPARPTVPCEAST